MKEIQVNIEPHSCIRCSHRSYNRHLSISTVIYESNNIFCRMQWPEKSVKCIPMLLNMKLCRSFFEVMRISKPTANHSISWLHWASLAVIVHQPFWHYRYDPDELTQEYAAEDLHEASLTWVWDHAPCRFMLLLIRRNEDLRPIVSLYNLKHCLQFFFSCRS